MCCYGPQILQRKGFNPFDWSRCKIVCYCNLAIQETRLDYPCHHKVFNKLLTDNGGEFVNEELITLCEALNIKVHRTGAESPWSKGIIEWHNLVLSEMLNKVLEENHSSLDIALA